MAYRTVAWLDAPWRFTLRKHAVVAALALLLVAGFQYAFAGLPPARAWNRALADAALVLLFLTMAAGPLARLAKATLLVRFRRELGIWTAVLAAGHVHLVVLHWLGLDAFVPEGDGGL